ncbi:MAG TPA: hypothetical protein VLT62_04530 [Candidatus Methylomirabilis sp.]|nr:hypothetical protein [Candidatus Methylomirabilis sp.]
MQLHGSTLSIQPLHRRKEISEIGGQLNPIDPEGNNANALGERTFDLAPHVRGCVGVLGKDQDKRPGLLDRGYDRSRKARTWLNVARSDPAWDARRLEVVTDALGHILVIGSVADEDLVRHARSHAGVTSVGVADVWLV